MLRLLIIDKTAGLAASHERHQAIAALPDVKLHVLGPKHWIENGRDVIWNPPDDTCYTFYIGKVFWKDYYARAGYYSGLTNALRQSQPDIIQLLEEPWSITAGQTLLAAKLFAPKAKILFYTWENIDRGWDYPSRGAALYRVIDIAMHKHADGAVCATSQAETVLRQKGFSQPTAVIPYGISNFFINSPTLSKKDNHRFAVGYVGRLLEMKGVDLLLHVAKQLPDIQLLIAGSGQDENKFKQLATDLQIAERVEWMHSVREEEMPSFMQRMDVLALPSRTTPGWMEQLGRVLIEAMAVGVPVIGSSSGAIPEVIADAGLVFHEDDANDLCVQIHKMMNDAALRESCIQKGKQRVNKRFRWDIFAKQLVEFYRQHSLL